MSLIKQIVGISELFHAPSIGIKNKACRLLVGRLWCSGHKKYLLCKSLCKRSIIVPSLLLRKLFLQSLVPGIWQNPFPLAAPANSHTVGTKHETMKIVNRIV